MLLSAVWNKILIEPIHLDDPLVSKLCNVKIKNIFWKKKKLIYNLHGLRVSTF